MEILTSYSWQQLNDPDSNQTADMSTKTESIAEVVPGMNMTMYWYDGMETDRPYLVFEYQPSGNHLCQRQERQLQDYRHVFTDPKPVGRVLLNKKFNYLLAFEQQAILHVVNDTYSRSSIVLKVGT